MAISDQVLPRTRPSLPGDSIEVPLVAGELRRYVNLDYAASAAPLEEVVNALEQCSPYYSSVHRGAGYKSQLSTAASQGARAAVYAFCRVRSDDVVLLTRYTTGSINLLSESPPDGASIRAFSSEHHAHPLSWQKGNHRVTYLTASRSAAEAIERLHKNLKSPSIH